MSSGLIGIGWGDFGSGLRAVFVAEVEESVDGAFLGEADGDRMPIGLFKPAGSLGGVFVTRWRKGELTGREELDSATLLMGLLCLKSGDDAPTEVGPGLGDLRWTFLGCAEKAFLLTGGEGAARLALGR